MQKVFGENNYPKIGEKEAFELYPDLITPDITELENTKGRGRNKRYNILNVLKNLKSVFTGVYLHYQDVPKETMFGITIAEKIKLRTERLDELKRKEQNINNELLKEYFTNYQNPSNMYKKLIQTEGAVNEVRIDDIKKILSKLLRIVDYVPKDNTSKIEENEKIIDIVERILEFNNKIQSGKGLKILTPNQMLSRLSITLARLKAGNNSEKRKNEIRQLLYSLYRSKTLTKQVYKSLIDII